LSFTHGKGSSLHGKIGNAAKLVPLLLLVNLVFFAGTPANAEPDLGEGKHLFRHYCAVCHGDSGKGNGINADSLGDVHPTDLTTSEFDKYDDEEIYEVIEGGGAAVDISYYMPPWGGVFSEDQIHSLVAYVRTLSQEKGAGAAEAVRFPDIERKGEKNCQICHAETTNLLRPIAPNIGHEGSKLKREWLVQFLRQPERLRPIGFMPFSKARMPNFYFTDDEVDALVDYLMTLKDEGIQADVLMGWDPSDPAVIEEGQFLFEEEYACDGCHKRSPDGEGGVVGPELSYAVERIRPEWMFYWIKNPQAIRPDTPMPNFRMPDDQIRAILSYLSSLSDNARSASTVSDRTGNAASIAKGKKLSEGKNCGGCHVIDSYNSQLGLGGEPEKSADDSEEMEEE